METIFEKMGGTYRQEGDYLVPNLELPDESRSYQIGKYGHMRWSYLKEHRPIVYECLALSGKLFEHLIETDRICNERMERMVAQMAECEGVTEALKALDQMAWVGRMNNIHNRAEEIIFAEVIYA